MLILKVNFFLILKESKTFFWKKNNTRDLKHSHHTHTEERKERKKKERKRVNYVNVRLYKRCVSYLDLGNHFIMYMFTKPSYCTL